MDRRAGAGRRSASVVGVRRLVVFSLALSMVAYGIPEGAVADDDWRWMVRYEMRFGGEPRSHRVNFLAAPGTGEAPVHGTTTSYPLHFTLYDSNSRAVAVLTADGDGGEREKSAKRGKRTSGWVGAAVFGVVYLGFVVWSLDKCLEGKINC